MCVCVCVCDQFFREGDVLSVGCVSGECLSYGSYLPSSFLKAAQQSSGSECIF